MNGVVLAVQEAAEEAGVERGVIELVNLRASQLNECAFCLEVHDRAASKAGVSEQKRALLAAWREAGELYTPAERAALGVAEYMTRVPKGRLSEEEYDGIRRELGDDAFSVIAWATVVINAFNRTTTASLHPVAPRQ